MRTNTKILIGFSLVSLMLSGYSREINKANGFKGITSNSSAKVMAQCVGANGSKELWVNNVRAIIFTAGDMWWDLFGSGNAYYIVPAQKDRSKAPSSLFAGSVWIGGYDAGGQLRVAAMTYRQSGYDYWPGPLDITNASVTDDVCQKYDKLFSISRSEVENYIFNPGSSVPYNMQVWPGNGDPTYNQDQYLAPFEDVDGDGYYDPTKGDYPSFDIYNKAEKDNCGNCKARLFGDYVLWWVFNDKGNAHTETQGLPIGLEIRAQAFAFQTSDEINNMTFYGYQIINRSTFELQKTYFTVWTDADLGYYKDDYVGCDVSRGLGYIYNADNYDESISGTPGYGDYPPACGADFFKGPLADPNDGIDNDFDGTPDEACETIGMTNFTYYYNNIGAAPPQVTNPEIAAHYYGYMIGKWKDGSPFTFGGNAYGGSTPLSSTNPEGRVLVFTGDPYTGTGWTEYSAGNPGDDKRFLQTAGPFTLKPGAVNTIVFGIPWAQTPIKNQQLYSIPLLKAADDKAQALFDNCFKILNGPDAPDLTIQELDQEIIIYLTNPPTSNNYAERYEETDVTILPVPGSTIAALANPDRKYRFQGYKVYQLRDETVTQTDLSDQTKAKLIFQCDIKDGVARIINYETDNETGQVKPVLKVDGSDKGIIKSFRVTTDAFAVSTSGANASNKLVNHKKYYFMAVAYAYNNYLTYKPDTDPVTSPDANYLGQKRPYLEGRKVKKAAGIPHINSPEKDGTALQSYYGYGPKITRIEGQGNGGNILDLTDESVNKILANNFDPNPTYINGRGPVNIKVIDPLKVQNTTYTLKVMKWKGLDSGVVNLSPVDGDILNMGVINPDASTWVLIDNNTGATYQLDTTLRMGKEYVMPDIGLSITMEQVLDPATTFTTITSGTLSLYGVNRSTFKEGDFLEATMTFAEPNKAWLTGIADQITSPNPSPFNWIRSGVASIDAGSGSPVTNEKPECGGPIVSYLGGAEWTDKDNVMANILGGRWAPYCITAFSGKNMLGQCDIFAGPGYDSRLTYGVPDANPSKVEPAYLSSIDLVITPDKSKWTRCIVIEMQDDPNLSEGGAKKFEIRKHPSVDKNGNTGDGIVTNDPNDADYIASEGMSWFPGYAINVETGERLNIVFGEDSWNYADNGKDLIWNPTARQTGSSYNYPFGGRHYIYVFGNNRYEVYKTNTSSIPEIAALDGKPVGAGRYDGCAQLYPQWKAAFANVTSPPNKVHVSRVMKTILHDAMWVNLPVLSSFQYSFKYPSQIPTEAKIRIRVRKPYRYGYSTFYTNTNPGSSPYYADLVSWRTYPFSASLLPANVGTLTNVSSNPQNGNFPAYRFSTSDIYTITNENDIAKNALDIIRVVPNPYYGYSTYEGNRLDTRIKITNLPSDCTIKIYTLNGTLIRTLTRNMENQEDKFSYTNDFKQAKWIPYIEWDLKNQSGVLISSGMYIIHVESPKFGEKIIKWFGIMRPYDLQSF